MSAPLPVTPRETSVPMTNGHEVCNAIVEAHEPVRSGALSALLQQSNLALWHEAHWL